VPGWRSSAGTVVLARIGCDVRENAEFVDVGIIFGVDSLEFWMKCFISRSGKTSITVVDADIGITNLEVGHVIITRQP
jgi:hypothetical protein